MNQINLERHLEMTNRLIALEKQLKRNLREVKTAANKQAIIQPTTWATVAGGNLNAPVITTGAGGTMTMVSKTTVQKKLNWEAELCSQQITVDLKSIVPPEALTEDMLHDKTVKALVTTLQSFDPELTYAELKSAC